MIAEILISYLVGSINFAYLLARLLKINIEKYGDYNLGATNLYYALLDKGYKKSIALAFFLLAGLFDILKAAIVTVLFGPFYGAFSIVGHCFSIFSIIKTRKIPSGVGLASTIGWIIVTDIRLLFLGLLMFPLFYLLFGDIFAKERGHIFSVFLYPFVSWIYTLLYPQNIEIIYGLLVITISVVLARFLRIKIFIKEKCLK